MIATGSGGQRAPGMLTLQRARAHAVVVILTFAAVYAVGILGRSGLVDRFGHVIGGDLLTPRMAARIVLDGRGAELYDFSLQTAYEQAAVEPERLPGLNPFIWPPFVALFYAPWAFVPWLAPGPALNRVIFEPGMPYALLSSVSALFLFLLGPQHLGAGMAAGALASVGLLAVLLTVWAGPWDARADGFALRFAALLVVSPLVGQYLLLHDLASLILAAVLLVECSLQEGAGEVPARVRVVLAVLWLTCLVGPPIITRIVRLPLVPLAVLLLGWVVLDTWRAAPTRA